MIRNMKKSLAYIVAIAALCACTNSQTAQQQAAAVPEQVTPKVSVVAATHQKVEHGAVYSSTVLANVTNNIAPQTGGRIQRILVDVGDFVKAGQVLAEMDRVQLDQASLNLANSETELSRLKELYAQEECPSRISKPLSSPSRWPALRIPISWRTPSCAPPWPEW